MGKKHLLAWLLWSSMVISTSPAGAVDSQEKAILDRGGVHGIFAGGVSFIDRVSRFSAEASLRVGLGARLEYAGPLALGALIVDGQEKGGVSLGIGVPDLFVNSDGKLLYPPTVVIGGKVRLGRQASLWGAFDFTGVEEGIQREAHAVWMRGSLALRIDFGRHATIAFGIAHQRILADGHHPEGLEEAGWAADARVSFGAVRAQAFSELPTLSIHLQPYLDLITLFRADVDLHSATTNMSWLIGIELKNRP